MQACPGQFVPNALVWQTRVPNTGRVAFTCNSWKQPDGRLGPICLMWLLFILRTKCLYMFVGSSRTWWLFPGRWPLATLRWPDCQLGVVACTFSSLRTRFSHRVLELMRDDRLRNSGVISSFRFDSAKAASGLSQWPQLGHQWPVCDENPGRIATLVVLGHGLWLGSFQVNIVRSRLTVYVRKRNGQG